MDPQVILIGIAAFVVSAVLIYLISAIGFKEQSYEEAIAEQKKRREAEQEKARKDKKAEKEKKKGNKKGKDKSKEKGQPTVETDISERKMVNLEIEPEIIEPQTNSDQENKLKSKSKKNLKPILTNKDEKPKVAPHLQEAIHFKATPKDELELLHEHEKEKKTHQQSKAKKEDKVKTENKELKKIPPVVEEMVVVQTQKTHAVAPTPDRKAKKNHGI